MTESEKIERAIESAKCRIYYLEAENGMTRTHQLKATNQTELMEITVSALEKQIPKKPINIADEFWDTWQSCPCCKKPIVANPYSKIQYPYCVRCGQKLKWGE